MALQQGVTSQQIFKMLMESQYWPPEQMLAYQRRQLEQLLRHAKANVPFYRTRLDCVFRKDGSIDWSRWDEIPILTREDVLNFGVPLRAIHLIPSHGRLHKGETSGSTGVPLTLFKPQLAQDAAQATWWRALHHWGIAPDAKMVRITANFPQGAPTGAKIYETLDTSTAFGRVVTLQRRLSAAERLELLLKVQADVIVDAANSMETVAALNLKRGSRLRFQSAIGFGMSFTEEQRRLIAESFGATCHSPYSSEESSLIGFGCIFCRRYHVTSEALLVEACDEQGKRVRPGEKGRAIITNFMNSATPFIRYDQSDDIIMASSDCRITLPSISAVEGRSNFRLIFPDREVGLLNAPVGIFRDQLGAIAFQIAQVKETTLEVRYVAPLDAGDEAKATVTQYLREMTAPYVEVRFVRMRDIPPGRSGKRHIWVREFEPPHQSNRIN